MRQRILSKPRTSVTAIIAAMAAVLYLCLAALPVHAAEGFDFYTDNPGIHVTAGDSVSFSLHLAGSNAAGSDVSLSVASMPEGFTGFFKSGSYEVSKVHAGGDGEDTIATFQTTVPTDVADGVYEIVLRAVSEAGVQDDLTITLTVSGLESGESNFHVEYPDQEGVTGTSFSYSTTIANNTLNTQNYNFSSNAPAGWTVAFTSNSTQVSSLEVESGSSASVTITVTPPEKAEAGDYTIDCAATSAKEQLSTALNVKILGTYDMELSTTDGRLSFDAFANKESDVTLKLTNSGNITLENISLTASAPSGWEVTFDTSVIDTLEAGASKEVVAHVTPGKDSLTGDYVTIMNASCDNQSAQAQFRVTVKTQTGWGIFAVIIIIAVAGGLYVIMKKYGRR
nr:NEW3 domain-containing protein [uncultured Acetatifactor sp.]